MLALSAAGKAASGETCFSAISALAEQLPVLFGPRVCSAFASALSAFMPSHPSCSRGFKQPPTRLQRSLWLGRTQEAVECELRPFYNQASRSPGQGASSRSSAPPRKPRSPTQPPAPPVTSGTHDRVQPGGAVAPKLSQCGGRCCSVGARPLLRPMAGYFRRPHGRTPVPLLCPCC